MPVVMAWQCKHTKKLFDIEDKAGYQKYLREQAKIRRDEKKKAEVLANWEEFLAEAKRTLKTPEEIASWIMENQQTIFTFVWRNEHKSSWRKAKLEKLVIKTNFRDICSNTHSSPAGKKTNWHCDKKLPRGYPGWTGRISGIFANHPGGFSSSIFGALDIHTGSGGGGEKFRYGVTIWADDWTGLKEFHDEVEFENRIKGLASKQ